MRTQRAAKTGARIRRAAIASGRVFPMLMCLRVCVWVSGLEGKLLARAYVRGQN